MSDDEKAQIIGRVVMGLADAQRTLSLLREKATRLSSIMKSVASVVDGKADWASYGGSDVQIDERGHVVKFKADEWSTLADIQRLTSEIETTKNEIARLEERRRELGV